MITVRAAKIALVAAIALFASLVAFGNLTDYNTNLVFVEHVLSMDTIYPFSTIKYRAITNIALQHAAYAVIITAEVIIAVLCWIGAIALVRNIRADASLFNRHKDIRDFGAHSWFPALARRLHVNRRRVVRNVAVTTMERRSQRLSLCGDYLCRSYLSRRARSRSPPTKPTLKEWEV